MPMDCWLLNGRVLTLSKFEIDLCVVIDIATVATAEYRNRHRHTPSWISIWNFLFHLKEPIKWISKTLQFEYIFRTCFWSYTVEFKLWTMRFNWDRLWKIYVLFLKFWYFHDKNTFFLGKTQLSWDKFGNNFIEINKNWREFLYCSRILY